MVLCHLDIRSFFHFRQLNRRARALSTGLHQYQLVSKHGLEGLRGLLRAGLADCFTILDFYRPLMTDKCSTCGGFGELLFLFAAERCCFNCLQSSAHYHVLPPICLRQTCTYVSKSPPAPIRASFTDRAWHLQPDGYTRQTTQVSDA